LGGFFGRNPDPALDHDGAEKMAPPGTKSAAGVVLWYIPPDDEKKKRRSEHTGIPLVTLM